MFETPSWKPSATLAILKQKAALIEVIRDFFKQKGYLEVDTPIITRFGVTDVYLGNIPTQVNGKPYYLQTSPEYPMKRLLAAGSGPIFQIAKVFRDDELGRWHNPEFTMLEWYQLDIDHHTLMEEVGELLQLTLQCPPFIKKTYQEVFQESGVPNPFTASIAELQEALDNFGLAGVLPPEEEDRDQYLFLLMSHVVEPFFSQEAAPIFVYDFPPSQAALAHIQQGFAQRFEVYYQGIELANGFHELTDYKIQAERFAQDLNLRRQKNLKLSEPDLYLLQALEHGLPPCSGVALGIDRLIAFALQQSHIAQILSFDFARI